MGQTWNIYNIDARLVSSDGWAKLVEFFFDDLSGLYNSLCLPVLPKQVDVWLKRDQKVMQPGPFGKLSVELIDQIYDELSDETMHVTVSLAITCKHLLEVGKRDIRRIMLRSQRPWIGGRIVCLGENTSDDELPQGLLSDAELKDLHDAAPPDLFPEQRRFTIIAQGLYHPKPEDTYWVRVDVCRALNARAIKKSRKNLDTPLEKLELKMFEILCCLDIPLQPIKGPMMVLCNTAKAEYVRQDRLSKMPVKGPSGSYDLGLAHALLSRICWSLDYSAPIPCDEEHLEQLIKGPWVGDRFCITTLDAMPPPCRGKKWQDVSAEADEWLRYLWEEYVL